MRSVAGCVLALLLCACTAWAHALDRETYFDPRPGARLPTSLVLRDELARQVPLRRFTGRVPIVLMLGYLACNGECARVADAAVAALRGAGLQAEVHYVPLFISVDPRDDGVMVQPRVNWNVLTGARAASEVARTVGFRYFYDERTGTFDHPSGFVVLTPDGEVSRYFTGARFDAAEVGAAVRAAQPEPHTLLERVLSCCMRDDALGRYGRAFFSVVQIGLALVASALFFLWQRR